MNTLLNQIAVVTGGTRGIGRAISLALLESGAHVVATYAGNEAAASALRDTAAVHGDRLSLARFDVADERAVEGFWLGLEQRGQDPVQILVNCAGIRRDQLLALTKPADWRAVLDTNLTGSFLMSKFAVQSMLRGRYGRIVFVTSPAALHGFPGQASYGASKAGQIGLMRSLAKEVGKKKITVNCVSPGFIDTELIADLPEETRKQHLASVPAARFGTPEEVAYAVRMLCDSQASYVHGSVLEVTGGL
jgi:3-oxoacyl-[acyl-carrier protein] reductase